jgi:hypothetical protein
MNSEGTAVQLRPTNEDSNDEKHEQVDVSGTKSTQIKPAPIAVPKVKVLNLNIAKIMVKLTL